MVWFWAAAPTILVTCMWLVREVAHRRRCRHQIAEFQKRATDQADALPAGYLFCDEQDRIRIWNARYAGMCGSSARLLKPGLPFKELITDIVRSGHVVEAVGREEAWLAERFARRGKRVGHTELQLADGRWVRMEDRKTPSGSTVLIALDLTDSRRQSEAQKLLFDSNPLPMWVLHVDTLRIGRVNAAAAEHFGWSAAELEGKSLLAVVAEDEHIELRRTLAGSGEQYNGERLWRFLKADGSQCVILPYHRRLPGSDEPQVLTVLVDVTQRARARQELEEQAHRLELAILEGEAASRAKDIFLANMSHEIRTPLNGVVAVADVLSRSELSATQADMVALIRSSGQALDRLLSDVLDLTRVEAGMLIFEEKPFRFDQAVREAVGLLKLRAEEKGLALDLEIDPAAEAFVSGDEVRVKQIVTNLVSNAVKFTASGCVWVHASRADDGCTTLTVSDTGIGFDEETRAKLFRRFQQADGSTTRRYGGSGLGLSICRELASRMGGGITCSSELGVGSTFLVNLPLPQAQPAASQPTPARTEIVRRLRVLLADDNTVNQQVGALVLEQADAEVTLAADGEIGLQAYMAAPFDLVLMDMQMPVRDGLSATRAIRAYEVEQGRPRVPLIMLTANAGPEHIAASMAAGADLHLAKPYTAAALLEAAGSIFERSDIASPHNAAA